LPLPESVYVFSDSGAETRLLNDMRVAIHGRSFRDRAVTENLARSYPQAVDGWFNIGMLHTSLAGNPQHETYAPCSIDDLALRGYDYWALGHVHEFAVMATNPHIVFSGNLQGRSVRECGPKGAVFVDVDGTSVTAIRRIIVDQARFADIRVDIAGTETEAEVVARMRDAFRALVDVAEDRLIAVRVRLSGIAAVHPSLIARRAEFAEIAQSALHHVYEDAWLEKFVVESREPEAIHIVDPGPALIDTAALLAGLEADPDMRAAAEALVEEIGSQWPSQQDFANTGLSANLDALLDEARTLVLARSSGKLATTTAGD
jgi:DNA repair exonuclease SbcCD nuclease subunit